MTIVTREPHDREVWLDEVVAAYLEEADRGRATDTRQWLSRYPELAGELADFFADQEKVIRWTAPLRQATPPASPPEDSNQPTVPYHPRPSLPTQVGPLVRVSHFLG
jgi:hypothetical protein